MDCPIPHGTRQLSFGAPCRQAMCADCPRLPIDGCRCLDPGPPGLGSVRTADRKEQRRRRLSRMAGEIEKMRAMFANMGEVFGCAAMEYETADGPTHGGAIVAPATKPEIAAKFLASPFCSTPRQQATHQQEEAGVLWTGIGIGMIVPFLRPLRCGTQAFIQDCVLPVGSPPLLHCADEDTILVCGGKQALLRDCVLPLGSTPPLHCVDEAIVPVLEIASLSGGKQALLREFESPLGSTPLLHSIDEAMCLYGRPRPGGARVQARRRGGMAGVACCTVSRRAWPRARARGAMALPRGRSSPQADEDGKQRSLSSKNMHSSCLSRCWCPECGDWLEDVEMQTKIALECWQCDKDARTGRLCWRCQCLCAVCAP